MENQSSNFESSEKEDRAIALEGARGLREEILKELKRFKEEVVFRNGSIHYAPTPEYCELHHEFFFPNVDRAKLSNCVVYHGLMGSTIPDWAEGFQIDLPGDESLMAFWRRKLAELKEK